MKVGMIVQVMLGGTVRTRCEELTPIRRYHPVDDAVLHEPVLGSGKPWIG